MKALIGIVILAVGITYLIFGVALPALSGYSESFVWAVGSVFSCAVAAIFYLRFRDSN